MSNGVFNFNFLALLLSEILGGPKFTLGGPMPPGRPLAENFFLPKASLDAPSGEIFVPKTSTSQYLIVFNFKILALVVSALLGVPNLR